MTEHYGEPAREIPVLDQFEVVVVGGGPAGCAAALAAARHGARTLLIEKCGYLGGATVSQLVAVILSTNGVDFQGVWHTFMRRLRQLDGVTPHLQRTGAHFRGCVNPEIVKYAWDQLLDEAGVRLLHHALCSGVMLEEGTVGGVILETRAGRQGIRAGRVIDCTGDGAVCAQAGVDWEQGDGKHKWGMALTKVFRMGNVHRPRGYPTEEDMAELRRKLDAAIERGEYSSPVITTRERLLNYIRGWLWELPEPRTEILSVISRVLKVDPLDPWEFSEAEREGRRQAWEAADFYRRYVDGFENAYLLDTSGQVGLRSSRRIRGRATVTEADAEALRKHADGIARGSWNIDVWPADSYTRPAVAHDTEPLRRRHERIQQGDYYDIRYGALLPRCVENLLVAGRCLSAEHRAEASLRIQQTCMATGEAAGVAAVLSLNQGVPPSKLDIEPLLSRLAQDRDVEPAFEELRDIRIEGK